MKKGIEMTYRNEYLIVKCKELLDQFECDCDRTVLGIVTDYTDYQKFGFEIYAIRKDGRCILIKETDDKKIKKEFLK